MTIKMKKEPPDGARLFLSGRLDANTAEEAGQNFLSVAEKYPKVVMDLGELEYISSAGLRSLLKTQKLVDRTGGDLTLTNVPGAIAEIFVVTGFDGFLKIK